MSKFTKADTGRKGNFNFAGHVADSSGFIFIDLIGADNSPADASGGRSVSS